MSSVNFFNLPQKICIIVSVVVVVLCKLSCSQQQNAENYADTTNANFFRFHDFEPRAFHFHSTNESIVAPEYNTLGTQGGKNSNRKDRGFHFQSTDKDLTVEVEFVIPLVRIPLDGGMKLPKSAMRNLLNLQSGSLLWVVAIFIIGSLVAGVFNSVVALTPPQPSYKRFNRSQNGGYQFSDFIINADNIGSMINNKLMDYNIDLNSCVQNYICDYVQQTTSDIQSSRASSAQKIIDGLLSTQISPQYLNGTAVHNAIEAGRHFNCQEWKERCRLPKF